MRWTIAFSLVLVSGLARPKPAPDATGGQVPGESLLVVTVTGLESDEGSVRIALFDDPEGFTEEPSFASVVRPMDGSAEWSVRVPSRTYALAAIHDEDDDGGLDTNFLGMPREPYGFSNGARGAFGPPSFEDASFTVEGDTVRVPLGVR